MTTTMVHDIIFLFHWATAKLRGYIELQATILPSQTAQDREAIKR